jgi:NADPH-dependent ferric siderophore reductase
MAAKGGKRPNSGRKPKADEIKLIEQMDAVAVPKKAWEALWAKCEEGDTQAIKTWINYRFGMPKQQMDLTSNGEKIGPQIVWKKS